MLRNAASIAAPPGGGGPGYGSDSSMIAGPAEG